MTRRKTLHARVTGMVQGVGFRYATLTRARRLGLRGYVRNMSDGSVEVVAEGDGDRLETLRRWLSQGPSGAYVRNLDARYAAYQGFYREFTVEY